MKNNEKIEDSIPGDHEEASDAEDEPEDFSSDVHFPLKYKISSEEAVSLDSTYILHLTSRFQGNTAKLVLGLSNYDCMIYDFNVQLKKLSSKAAHTDTITGVKLLDCDEHLFYTSSLDGTVKLWDLRNDDKPSLTFKDNTDGDDNLKPISCFDVTNDNNFLCAGTPLVEADSYLLFWDVRKASVLGGYWEAHTDDITQVKFNPQQKKIMLSASTDGLINIYDVSKNNEDDALENTLNTEMSLRKIEWLQIESEDIISCVTDMETFQLWRATDVQPYLNFSRKLLASTMYLKSWDNVYISDIYQLKENEFTLLGGSNVMKGEYLKSLSFSDEKLKPSASFEKNKQIVRCSSVDKSSQVYVTGGESGILSVWSLSDEYEKANMKERNFYSMKHFVCRANDIYPHSNGVKRIHVPDDKVSWNCDWPEYNPPDYTSPHIVHQVWADPLITDRTFKPRWNLVDSNVDRTSFTGIYQIVNNRPLNPVGRTGLQGRGVLGRWGPNKAADPIVTRWKTINDEKVKNLTTHQYILQFVAIERRDTGDWAIPGGMVDPNEHVSSTLKREFMEETMSVLNKADSEKKVLAKKIDKFFANGDVVYKGYVDDRRNTDNAWIETTAIHYHDENNESVGSLPFEAGDDARNVQWMDISKDLKLYANHCILIENVAKSIDAHW